MFTKSPGPRNRPRQDLLTPLAVQAELVTKLTERMALAVQRDLKVYGNLKIRPHP